jgi:hypothetical protein
VGVGGPCSVRLSYSGWAARAGLEPARASRPLPGSSRVPYQLGHLAMEPPVRIERTSAVYETAALALSYEGPEPAPDWNGPRPYQGRAPQVSYAGGWGGAEGGSRTRCRPRTRRPHGQVCRFGVVRPEGFEPPTARVEPGALPVDLRARVPPQDSNPLSPAQKAGVRPVGRRRRGGAGRDRTDGPSGCRPDALPPELEVPWHGW